MRIAVIGVLVLGLAGCAVATPAGEKVRLVGESRMVDSCAFISQVTSSSIWGESYGDESTDADLRNKAAAAGGDTLLVVTTNVNRTGAKKTGDAYRCRK